MKRWAPLLLLACIGWPSFMACSGGPPHPPYSPQATTALTLLDFGPPPGRVELIPPRPAGADAWVDGEWVRRHGRWYWLVGRWVKTPPGATYSPWVLVRATDGTPFYAPSVWKNAQGVPIAPPTAMALARASGGAVVDPENVVQTTGRNLTTLPASRTVPPSPGSEASTASPSPSASAPPASPSAGASAAPSAPPSGEPTDAGSSSPSRP